MQHFTPSHKSVLNTVDLLFGELSTCTEWSDEELFAGSNAGTSAGFLGHVSTADLLCQATLW